MPNPPAIFVPCPSSVHENEAHHDHCWTCAPFWARVPACPVCVYYPALDARDNEPHRFAGKPVLLKTSESRKTGRCAQCSKRFRIVDESPKLATMSATKITWMPRTIDALVDRIVNVKSFEAFTDGSGAPAVIEVTGYTFAFDHVGTPSCNLIGHPVVTSRMANEGAARRAKAAYETLLRHLLTPAWHDLNKELYRG